MDPDVTRKWRLGTLVDLHWHSWDDESVVFDSASGDTHLFEPISVEVLRFIEESVTPQSMYDIVQHLLPMLDESEAALLEHTQKVIATFNRLGLVEQDSS